MIYTIKPITAILKYLTLLCIALFFGVCANSTIGIGCPANLFGFELNPGLPGKRSEVRGYHFLNGQTMALPLPVQVDPVNDNGRLVFYDDDAWKVDQFTANDRLVMRTESFGRRLDPKKDWFPCKGPVVYEVESQRQRGRFAYLTTCQGQPEPTFKHAVTFQGEAARLETSSYIYQFDKSNNMLFDAIWVKRGGLQTLVASDSKLLIHADVKNFFNMNFNSDDIESELERTRLGPVSNLAQLSFYLRVLFFRIKMSLTTDVAFYQDSGHIPMMVQIPVESPEYLNSGSGIVYSWILDEAASASQKVNMPRFQSSLVHGNLAELARVGLEACVEGYCRYSFTAEFDGKQLAMSFGLRKELVEAGFFPLFIDDVRKEEKAMDWERGKKTDRKRLGIYFEVSGLKKGGHPWDFWLSLGAPASTAAECPAPLYIRKLRGLPR